MLDYLNGQEMVHGNVGYPFYLTWLIFLDIL